MLGDRWSLLIIRDMMLRGSRTFKEFLDSYERIATNILADRLRKLISYGVITTEADPTDGRYTNAVLTEAGHVHLVGAGSGGLRWPTRAA